MELKVAGLHPPCADGRYYVTARGFAAATLYWADGAGLLPNWTALAHLPLDASGQACFPYRGGRAPHLLSMKKEIIHSREKNRQWQNCCGDIAKCSDFVVMQVGIRKEGG